ncbi:MAG: metalloregulator ArsR/SmtB family transcription factor [Clostridiaceae bacterium]|jgi:DNA-binding transcriptional ArsR family regulator|nr:metalloregulator ArsR/SmtB family transcription factor [Clostridiaceae bacterium]
MQAEEYAKIFKALSHPIRLNIACGLLHKGKCNVNTMVERLHVSQSLVSQHINILKNAGIIKGCREGNLIWYTFENKLAKQLLQNINLKICE